jgi:hypothetical protein
MKLYDFLKEALPEIIPQSEEHQHIRTRDDFIMDVMDGIDRAPMSIRIPPHIISSIDWANPLEDPLRRQFIPMKSAFQPDHPALTLDSLNETNDSPVKGLVHRYNDKCLFLGTSLPPTYLIMISDANKYRSIITLPSLLPVLHTFLLRRSRHFDRHQDFAQAPAPPLGSHAPIHRLQPRYQRRRHLRRRLILSHARSFTPYRRPSSCDPSRPPIPHRYKGSLRLPKPNSGSRR